MPIYIVIPAERFKLAGTRPLAIEACNSFMTRLRYPTNTERTSALRADSIGR